MEHGNWSNLAPAVVNKGMVWDDDEELDTCGDMAMEASPFNVEVRRVFLFIESWFSLLNALNADLLSSENIEWPESVFSDVIDEILFWLTTSCVASVDE